MDVLSLAALLLLAHPALDKEDGGDNDQEDGGETNQHPTRFAGYLVTW